MKTFGTIILLFLSACGDFNYSPYVLDIESTYTNDLNLERILNQGSIQASAKSVDFKIAVISDTHDYYDGLEKQVRYINKHSEEYDFVIVTGDMSNVGLVSEFEQTKRRLDRLTIPYITTIGNHDLLIDGQTVYSRMFGKDTYAFEYKNTKFVLFNNNNWESSSNIPDLGWVESELVSNSKPHLILLSHVAPDDRDRFTNSQIHEWKELVNRYGVNYYINGHDHNPGEGFFGDAIQITAGSSSKNVLFELNIRGGGMDHAFINL